MVAAVARYGTADQSVAQRDTSAAQITPLDQWETIVRDHQQAVYRYAYRLCGNQHDAEDLTQETFIRVFRALDSYQPGGMRSWLYRITSNLFIDKKRHEQVIRMESLGDKEETSSDTPRGISLGVDTLLSDRVLHPALASALSAMPEDYRVAVVLRDIDGYQYDEIADMLGIKIGTVRSRLHRGRKALRESLGGSVPVWH